MLGSGHRTAIAAVTRSPRCRSGVGRFVLPATITQPVNRIRDKSRVLPPLVDRILFRGGDDLFYGDVMLPHGAAEFPLSASLANMLRISRVEFFEGSFDRRGGGYLLPTTCSCSGAGGAIGIADGQRPFFLRKRKIGAGEIPPLVLCWLVVSSGTTFVPFIAETCTFYCRTCTFCGWP